MRTKQPGFLVLLEAFLTEHMPFTAGLSENTIRLYKFTFRLLLDFFYTKKGVNAGKLTFAMLDYEAITAFLDWLETERGCTASTRNVRLAALSSFATYAQNKNLEAASVFCSNVRKIPAKKTAAVPRITFTVEEVSLLLRLPNLSTTEGRRDAALLSLMYASGARAQEICDLRVRDIQFGGDHTRLTITGKGNKTRRIIIAQPCAETLKKYLLWRGLIHEPDRHIFSSRTHEHMTVSCIEAIYKKYLVEAKQLDPALFQEKRYSPHTMRHTCATHMLEAGVPLVAIKNFLGHATLATTERYAELSQATVDRHIRDWNNRWFSDSVPAAPTEKKNILPDFLK